MAPRTHVICALVFGIGALVVAIATMVAERWDAMKTGHGVLPALLALSGIVALLVIAGRALEAIGECERMRGGGGNAGVEGVGRHG